MGKDGWLVMVDRLMGHDGESQGVFASRNLVEEGWLMIDLGRFSRLDMLNFRGTGG